MVFSTPLQELVKKLRGLAYKKPEKLPRTCVPMNQIPKQVEAIGPSSFQPEIIRYTDATAEIQGMKNNGRFIFRLPLKYFCEKGKK